MAGAHVLDVTADTFQKEIVERSMLAPVLIDFWAAWCGPCKTLSPVLEKFASEYGGAFTLAKVDSEREPELAHAFGVQGIPYCVLVDGGRPVDAFQGALREPEVKRFLQHNGIEPLATAPKVAAAAPIDPDSPEGRLRRALEAASAGDSAGARKALAGFPEEDERIDRVRRLEEGLAFLEAPLQAQGNGAEGELAAARHAYLRKAYDEAMERVLASVAANKDFSGGLARKAMLLCFLAVGEEDEHLDVYRRRLATLLY